MKFGNFEIRILPEVKRPEFTLVLAMLLSLVVLVVIILSIPLGNITPVYNQTDTRSLDAILKWRLDILSLIITAFGAWVGAGAAYFFGKENLKTTTDSLMAAIESPKTKLQKIKIQDLPPHKLTKTFLKSDKFEDLYKYFIENTDAWFIPIVDEDKRLKTVINEEGVYRYKLDNEQVKTETTTIEEFLNYVKKDQKIKKVTDQFWSELKSDNTLATADEIMSLKNTRIGIITDSAGIPTQFITTGDIRRFLLK
ncbi:MAG: hypothetical protein LUQ31_01175 [Methanoregula sp.]|nr:hypothetical protein [Methanoregula sp.]